MTTPINEGYYQPSLGSLTGFNSISDSTDNIEIFRKGWSIDELTAFLLNEDEQNFASKEWVMAVEELITRHIADKDNPHQTSLDQTISDWVREIIQAMLPGTIPSTPPFYSFQAAAELQLGDIFPGTTPAVNLRRVRSDGIIENATGEGEYTGIDYTVGYPGLPLFRGFQNVLESSWRSVGEFLMNTTVIPVTPDPLLYCPETLYMIRETAVNGIFGIRIVVEQNPDTAYTFNAFLKPAGVLGSVKIYQPGDPTKFAQVSLSTGEVLSVSSGLQIYAFRYPNDIIRISFSFRSLPIPDNMIEIAFYDDALPIGPRLGSANRNIFAIGYPTITGGNIAHPTSGPSTDISISSPLTVDMLRVTSNPSMSYFTMGLTVWMLPNTNGTPVGNSTILSYGTLSIGRDASNIYVNINSFRIFTVPIQEGINKLALSYSPTTLIFKTAIDDRQISTGTFAPITSTTMRLGPFGGYLIEHVIYNTADTNQNLEFLTDG